MQQHELVGRGAPLVAAAGLLVGLSASGHSSGVRGQPFEDEKVEWLGDE